MSATDIAIVLVVALVVLAAAVGLWLWWRHRSLRSQFGPEYDRAAAEHDSRIAAERDLRDRQRRHAELELRPLDEATRRRYASSWERIQAQFVETPEVAADAAQSLVVQLIGDRGYPTDDYDDQVRHLSVEHARTLDHYRQAREIYTRHQEGRAGTEDLRRALVHYRVIFADLLGQETSNSQGNDRDRTRAGSGERSHADERAGNHRSDHPVRR